MRQGEVGVRLTLDLVLLLPDLILVRSDESFNRSELPVGDGSLLLGDSDLELLVADGRNEGCEEVRLGFHSR